MHEFSLEQSEQLHAEYVETGLSLQASKLRAKVRDYCSDNALPIPAWAIGAPTLIAPSAPASARKPSRNYDPSELDQRAERHAALVAEQRGNEASALRTSTRKWCTGAGLPVPEWAAPRTFGPKPKPEAGVMPEALREWRDAAAGRMVSIEADGTVTLLRQTEKGLLKATFRNVTAAVEKPAQWRPATTVEPARPLELPRALKEWRSMSGDRVVSVASDGTVTLFRSTVDGGKQQAAFPSLAAAAAAVEPPIKWQHLRTMTAQAAFLSFPRRISKVAQAKDGAQAGHQAGVSDLHSRAGTD